MKIKIRGGIILPLLFMLAFVQNALAVTVYYDNKETGWTQPKVHYWGGSESSKYPGDPMTLKSGTIWMCEIPDGSTGILFAYTGDADKSADFEPVADHVYTKAKGDSGMTYDEYIDGNIPDIPTEKYTVYYDNKDSKWDRVCCYAWGGGTDNAKWPGVDMTNISGTLWAYDVDKKFSEIIFNNGTDKEKTADLTLRADHVYTKEGDSGKTYSEYVGTDPIIPTEPFNVYFDNYLSNWSTIKCLVRLEGEDRGDSNGDALENFKGSIYRLTVPANCEELKFNDGGTVNIDWVKAVPDMVYSMSGSTGKKISQWTTPILEDVYVYFHGEWNAPYVYVYTGEGNTAVPYQKWPGELMTYDGASGYWRYKVPDGFKTGSKVIIYSSTEDRYPMDGHGGMLLEGKSMIFKASSKEWLDFASYPQVNPDRKNALGEYVSFTDAEGTVEVKGTEGSLYITPWAPEVVKIFTLHKDAVNREPRPSISVVDKNDPTLCYDIPAVEYKVLEDNEYVYVELTDGVKVHVAKATMLVSFYQGEDLLLSESTGLVNSATGGSTRIGFSPNDIGEAFYGAGYNGNFVNLDNQAMEMNNTQAGGWGQGTSGPLNICIPYYVSTNGYGVFFDSNYRGATIRASKNGSIYTSSSPSPVAYYFCGGGTMEKAMQNYNLLTGHQPLPPYWALGYISSKFSFIDDNEARNVSVKTREKNIPIDGIVLDIAWQGGNKGTLGTYGMGYLDWDPDNYKNKGQMVQDLLKKNIHTVAICEPFFNSEGNASANYNHLKSKGWLADERVSANDNMNWISGNSSIPVGLIDATNEEAMQWFADKLVTHSKDGMSGWWLDLGEPEAYTSQFEGNTHHKTGTPSEVHNEFGNLWTGAVYKRLATSTEKATTADDSKIELKEMRHMTMPRAGTAGMQRYGAMPWTGDIKRSWEGLKAQVPALVSAAMSGVSFLGSDIGGFTSDGTNPELYRRWVQLGVFYPMMRTHSKDRPEVFNSEYKDVLDDVRTAINLRYAYLPYTYTQAYRQTAFGSPIARPINFDDKEQPLTNANCIDEYLWGPDILVAPVLTSNDTRNITFPAGDWLDMNDFKSVHKGYSSYTPSVPKSQIPHFMRRGSLIPRYKQDTFTNTTEIKDTELIIDYFPLYDGSNTHSYFYDDDKTGVDNVRKGKYQLMHFTANAGEEGNKNALAISIEREGNGWEGMPETHDITFRIHDFKVSPGASADETLTPSEVNIVWKEIPVAALRGLAARAAGKDDWSDVETFDKCNSQEALGNATGNSYYHDKDNGTFYLRMPAMRTDRNYVMNLGSTMIFTGTDKLVDMSSMTLAYGAGLFTYSLPEGTRDASLEVYTSTGMLVASISDLTATGYASQTGVDLQSGVYIAVLAGTGSDGVRKQKTVKMVVR